eukprot:gene8098-8179_t
MRRLSLDHLTVVDATPLALIDLARATGCAGICLFMAAMDVLPLMPRYDCLADRPLRAATRQALAGQAITLDLVYPFTLTGRTDPAALVPALDCAADLGARAVNALIYDRDSARRAENFGRFCDLALGFGLNVAVEFYPPSQIASLGAGLDLVNAVGQPGRVGLNVDLLHLMRSGGTLDQVAAAPPGTILFGQIADGTREAPADLVHEASSHRLRPGEGAFDIAGFVRALPASCPISIEIPRDDLVPLLPAPDRARLAVESVRADL